MSKARITYYIVLLAVAAFCLMMASVSRASETEPRSNSIPVIVEARAWKGHVLLAMYHPASGTLCFINEGSKACLNIEEFSPEYKRFVESKVQALKEVPE